MPRLSRWSSRRSGPDTSPAAAEVLALAAEAEAEAAAAEAEAAEAAARAARLRARTPPAESEPAAAADEPGPADTAATTELSAASGTGSRLAAVGAAATVLGALVGTGGFLAWHHHTQARVTASKADFVAAAERGVVNLLSMDFNRGDEDLQRLIESTTGEFRADFEKAKNDFLTVLRSAKVTTRATVRAGAVEELYRDSAVVLVGASSEVSNTAAADQQPRAWRLRVTVNRDGDEIKMSKVEFVP